MSPSIATPHSSLSVSPTFLSGQDAWLAALQEGVPEAVHRQRYLRSGIERGQALEGLRGLLEGAAAQAGFSREAEVLVAACPGRSRLFMGHADLHGLGGHTVDCTIAEELLMVGQFQERGAAPAEEGPWVCISSAQFTNGGDSSTRVSVAECMEVARSQQGKDPVDTLFDPVAWDKLGFFCSLFCARACVCVCSLLLFV